MPIIKTTVDKASSEYKARHLGMKSLVFDLHDVVAHYITGYIVGQKYGARGIAKDDAKMLMAVACANVPRLTLIIWGSFGAGNYAMCERGYDPRFLWMWPNVCLSVMDGEQAALILIEIRRSVAASRGLELKTEDDRAFQEQIQAEYEREGPPYYANACQWDDGIIDLRDTRTVLGLGLVAALNAPILSSPFGVFRM